MVRLTAGSAEVVGRSELESVSWQVFKLMELGYLQTISSCAVDSFLVRNHELGKLILSSMGKFMTAVIVLVDPSLGNEH